MKATCLVCGGPTIQPMESRLWQLFGREYRLVWCDACGSAYSDPVPDDEILKRLYRQHFDYRWYRDHYEAKLLDAHIRVKEYGERLGRRVLDFGGGLGYFSHAAREAGLNSVTYDPYAADADPGGDWDCVVALHVLEHTNDLDRAISQMKCRLRPGGSLLLAVPNFCGEGYRRMGMDWVWAQPPLVHVFHFTATGLAKLVERHGFAQVVCSYHERWDANTTADIEHAKEFRRADSAWGYQPFSRLHSYRRWVVRRNTKRRFAALGRSLVRSEGKPLTEQNLKYSPRWFQRNEDRPTSARPPIRVG